MENLIHALLKIDETCNILFTDKNNKHIGIVKFEDITDIKTELYEAKVAIAKLKSLDIDGRRLLRIKFLDLEKEQII